MFFRSQVDPDELSPNMRLGLPDESRYDLDRLMFSPEAGKNATSSRAPRREMLVEGLEVALRQVFNKTFQALFYSCRFKTT